MDDDLIEFFPATSESVRSDLYVAKTQLTDANSVKYPFWGLYCHKDLHAGEFIGMYSGMWIHADDDFEFGNRYALKTSYDVVVAPPSAHPDPQRYPIAMANEPAPHTHANAYMIEYVFDREEVRGIPSQIKDERFFGMALYACRDIPANAEITWVYGNDYSRDYIYGDDCASFTPPTAHPFDVLGGPIPYDAVSPFLDSPSATSSDDDSLWRAETMLRRLRIT